MESGTPYALRLDMRAGACAACRRSPGTKSIPFGLEASRDAATADPALWGDVVLARKEVRGSYHLAVVVDDAFQGVTRHRARQGP